MFDDLRRAFGEALDNFNKELKRDHVPENVDRLLVGMKGELADETAEVRGLEVELEKATAASAREKAAGETCRRREKMARDIADEDTATLAAQHAAKHEGHHAVLERKTQAIREELEYRRKTLAEMSAQLDEAMRKRGALGASAGRTEARQAFAEADDLFSELDRMAEKMTGERTRAEAAEEVDALDLEDATDASDYEVTLDEPPPPREELDVDAALAELKRRMGRQ
jgi:phage shock protein A